METDLKEFIRISNGWNKPFKKTNPNLKGEQKGRLWLDGQLFAEGSFSVLQKKKSDYCKTYGISKEKQKQRFKITY